MKTVLFLGAGASAFAGCPATKKLRELTLGNIHKRLGDLCRLGLALATTRISVFHLL